MKKAIRKAKKPKIEYMSDENKTELKSFVYFALGDPELSAFEANFIARMRQLCDYEFLWLSDKQLTVIQQIKEKLRYQMSPLETPLKDDSEDTSYERDNVDEAALYSELFGIKDQAID